MVWKAMGKRVLLRWRGYGGKSGRLAPAGGPHVKLSLGAHVIPCISSIGKFGEDRSLRTHQKDKELGWSSPSLELALRSQFLYR